MGRTENLLIEGWGFSPIRIFESTMRTNNKCTEVGASHEGSRRPKTTVAKGTKGNSSAASSSSKKRTPAKRISGPMGNGVFGVRVFIPRDRNPCSPLLHFDLEEHISFKLTLKKIRGCGNNDICATWYNKAMHDTVKAKVKESGFLPFLSILGHGKKGDRPLLVALAERWWDTTHTFHFDEVGEMTMTPRTSQQSQDCVNKNKVVKLFGKPIADLLAGERRVPYESLCTPYWKKNPKDDKEADQIARAFILCLIGSSFLNDKSQYVSMHYAPVWKLSQTLVNTTGAVRLWLACIDHWILVPGAGHQAWAVLEGMGGMGLRVPKAVCFIKAQWDLEHVAQNIESAVGCKGLSDEGQCLLFPSSLTEAALNWFYRLEPEMVDSFDELKQIFLNHFMIQTDRLYSVDDLYTIRQREDEPLREYAARFSHEYSRCPETDNRAAYGAFKSGLRSSHFRYLVHSSNWRTYDELMKQAAVHAKAEYFNSKPSASARREDAKPSAYPAKAPSYDRTDSYSAGHKRKDNRDDRRDQPKKGKGRYGRNDNRGPLPNLDHGNEVFTLLNTTYETVLMNEQEAIPKPNVRRPNRQDNRETGKFCRYHQHNSHNTEDCISLRKIVERLIREGNWTSISPGSHRRRCRTLLADKHDQHYQRRTYHCGDEPPFDETVCACRAVPSGARNRDESVPGTPKVRWEPITFCQEEEEGILYPHDDPMIIRAEIADYDVGRVLIDTGSSVSVIFAEAFREMGINDTQVDRQLTPLLSFSGDLVQPIGSVRLPITFGTAPRKATTYDQFLIVDCPTAYNVIVGRTALTRIKAHLSPHMLLMKFPTRTARGQSVEINSARGLATLRRSRQPRSYSPTRP
ncbi:hypothetical protein Prudu_008748 [Prunus dulcis]|uniref:Retrotransposon gag domain-containing protein n=1 Tax=Prunus dulcis TaxID=3755 RepID=A0A4Y1R4V2_PRUDU|nr:hypothetical protein Prudu_008748 [Prunus dulcis]